MSLAEVSAFPLAPATRMHRRVLVSVDDGNSIAAFAPVGGRNWARAVVPEIRSLSMLGDGWDGGQARAVSTAAVEVACEFAGLLGKEGHLPRPQVAPLVNGGVAIEWEKTDAAFEVIFAPDGATIVSAWSDESGDWEGPLDLVPEEIQAVLSGFRMP